MVTQIKLAIVVILAYLDAFGFAHVDNDPPTVARYQLFPRNEVLTVTVIDTACAPLTSQSSSVASSTPVSSSSPSASSSGSPSTPVTPTPSSSAPLPSTHTGTSWIPTPSSTAPIFSNTPSSVGSSSSASSSSVSSSSVSSSSVSSSSVSYPASKTTLKPTNSETTKNTATTTTGGGSSTSTPIPPKQGIASHQTRVQTSIVLLLVLVNILAIYGLGSTVV